MTESVKALLKLKKRTLSIKQRKLHNFSFGQAAENQATIFLINQGYKILATNVMFARKEVDIVALDVTLNELVFVEVKFRASQNFGSPSFAVNQTKLKAMAYVAGAYRRQHHLTHQNFRFDIVSIIGDNIEHFKNVTWIR